MKIAFLSLSYGAVERGAEIFVYEVSKRLSGMGNEVTIISDKKIPAKRWPFFWRLFLDPHGIQVCLFTLKNLPKIWRERYDVVIPLDGGWEPAWVRLITWVYGGKMVISGQSGKGWDDRNNLWCFPDTFVALSSMLSGWAKKTNPLVKTEYIANGVDTDKFKPGGPKVNFNIEKPIILCVGALSEDKRIELAIKAVSKLENGSLVVIGGGQLRKSLTELGKKLLGKRFLITEYNFSQMPKVYRAADLFTLPSPWYRAFEIVLVEAMATNLPVVANDDPIRREIVAEAGILVDPTKIDGYAKALKEALNTNWGGGPRKQAEKFDWDRIAKKYEKLFLEIRN